MVGTPNLSRVTVARCDTLAAIVPNVFGSGRQKNQYTPTSAASSTTPIRTFKYRNKRSRCTFELYSLPKQINLLM